MKNGKPLRKTSIIGTAFGALLLAGTIAACAPDSLALHASTTPTPAVASRGVTANVQGRPASIQPSTGMATSAPVSSSAAIPVLPPSSTTSNALHGIAVTGTGQVAARPDEAIVQVGVQTRAPNAQDAQATNNKTMQSVIDAIKAQNIPAKDIQTTGISLYPIIAPGNTITGYNAMNSVTVTVENVDQAGVVLDAAVKAGANTSTSIRFTFKDETALRNKALAAAAADAKSKAETLANALGLRISGVQSVTEGQVNIPRPFAPGAAMSAAAAAPSVPIEPGQQTVTAQVTVVFGF